MERTRLHTRSKMGMPKYCTVSVSNYPLAPRF